MNNIGRKSLQFELWAECRNLCKFCFLGKENRRTPPDLKLKALRDTLDRIKSEDWNVYNCISFIGGDFFQGELENHDINSAWFHLMGYTASLLKSKKIDTVWLTCTMTIGKNHDLYATLDVFKDCWPDPTDGASGLWLCTSWDIEGRFHTDKNLENWENHMLTIHEKYPNVKFNTTTILTPALMEAYLDGSFSFKEFSKKFNTTFFIKQPCLCDTDLSGFETDGMGLLEKVAVSKVALEKERGMRMFPTKELAIRFFTKMASDDFELYDKMFNILYRADELIRNLNSHDEKERNIFVGRDKTAKAETTVSFDSTINPKCGHMINYTSYIDCDGCMICDRNAIQEMVTGIPHVSARNK
jgi:hypothetical protein